MEDDDLDLDALVERSRRQFVDSFPADFEQLTSLARAAATGDDRALTNLRLAAHRLVGRAGILQFTPLARHAAALETVARVDEARHFDAGAAAACLAAMRDAFTDLRPESVGDGMASRPRGSRTPPAPARQLVLVADDDDDQRFLLTRLLQRAGFDVEAVATGEELLSLARTRRPAAILLDVQMPEQDGYSTGRRLRDDPATASVPVMFLSGLSEPGDGARGRAAGAADYASKSIDPVELLDRVRALCARITPSSG
jgi:CheY-like chemotaxis protein